MWKIVGLMIAVGLGDPYGWIHSPGSFVAGYSTWEDMKAELQQYNDPTNCNNMCELQIIGQSYEDRNLYVMKFHEPNNPTKPSIWIQAGIAARAWISHATALHFIRKFVNEYQTDTFIQDLLTNYNVYIVPCVNPDGYVYSWTPGNRDWKKNRKPSGDGCIGSDIDRNFNHNWNTVGTSNNNPCGETYPGSAAESEPETKAVADYVTSLQNNGGGVVVFLNLDAYGQKWIFPWGYTEENPSNYENLIDLAEVATNAMGTQYTYGQASTILGYLSSGTSTDWAYGMPQIENVFTVILRDTGEYGYELPAAQINPTGEETWDGFVAMMEALQS